MRRRLLTFGAAALLSLAMPLQAAEPTVRVVYRVNEGAEQASRAIVSVPNHLNFETSEKIVVVAFDKSIDFLLDDTKDPAGSFFDAAVAVLTQREVARLQFRDYYACLRP